MSVRRVPRSPGSHLLPHGDYRGRVVQSAGPEEPVTITYFRITTGQTYRLGPRLDPTNCVIVGIPSAEHATNLNEGKALARETMRQLADGEIAGEERLYALPAKPERVATLDHPKKMLQAVALRSSDGYEVRTTGYVPNGYTLPVSTPSFSVDPDFEWGRLDLFERLLADSLEEATTAAEEELARHAASDAPIRLRGRQ